MMTNGCLEFLNTDSATCQSIYQTWREWVPAKGIADYFTGGNGDLFTPILSLHTGRDVITGGGANINIRFTSTLDTSGDAGFSYPKGLYTPGPVIVEERFSPDIRMFHAVGNYVALLQRDYRITLDRCHLWSILIGGALTLDNGVYIRYGLSEISNDCLGQHKAPAGVPSVPNEVVQCAPLGGITIWPSFHFSISTMSVSTQTWTKLGPRKKRFAGQKDSESWRKLHAQWRAAENFRRWQKKLTKKPNARGRGRKGTGIFRTWNQRFQVITPKGRAAQSKLCRVDRTNRERERVALLKEKAKAKLQKARDVLEARIERMKLSRFKRESAIKEIRFNAIRRRQKIENDLRLEKQRCKVREAKLREQKKRCAPAPRRRGRVRRRRLTSRGTASRRRKGISAVKRK